MFSVRGLAVCQPPLLLIQKVLIMSVEYYKKKLIDLRSDLAKEKEAKKRDNERYAGYIKNASTPSSKASYRKQKIDHAASHDRRIESIKRDIERTKESLASERKRAKK